MAPISRTPSSERVLLSAARVKVFKIPTESPESDGTFAWDATSMLYVELVAGGHTGMGYAYTSGGGASAAKDLLFPALEGRDVLDIPAAWLAMAQALRNVGRTGIGASALSAVDCALWDLKARLLNVSLSQLLGQKRGSVPVYGSGGFTSYSVPQLTDQLGGWAEAGFGAVKMKVGRDPQSDLSRVDAARRAIGEKVGLFVDANGAYSRKQALSFAQRFHELGVIWFEEPVSSDDIEGLRLLSEQAPAPMDVSAGEYIYDLFCARRLIEDARIDVLQADVTRCGGISEYLRIDALCQAHCLPLSSHTAPALHLPVCAALKQVRHMEYFHDHVRIEKMLFEGAVKPVDGVLTPDISRPGNGLSLKVADAQKYVVS